MLPAVWPGQARPGQANQQLLTRMNKKCTCYIIILFMISMKSIHMTKPSIYCVSYRTKYPLVYLGYGYMGTHPFLYRNLSLSLVGLLVY
jgi:hypothetical protein